MGDRNVPMDGFTRCRFLRFYSMLLPVKIKKRCEMRVESAEERETEREREIDRETGRRERSKEEQKCRELFLRLSFVSFFLFFLAVLKIAGEKTK